VRRTDKGRLPVAIDPGAGRKQLVPLILAGKGLEANLQNERSEEIRGSKFEFQSSKFEGLEEAAILSSKVGPGARRVGIRAEDAVSKTRFGRIPFSSGNWIAAFADHLGRSNECAGECGRSNHTDQRQQPETRGANSRQAESLTYSTCLIATLKS
jgi:hypothetical protein